MDEEKGLPKAALAPIVHCSCAHEVTAIRNKIDLLGVNLHKLKSMVRESSRYSIFSFVYGLIFGAAIYNLSLQAFSFFASHP